MPLIMSESNRESLKVLEYDSDIIVMTSYLDLNGRWQPQGPSEASLLPERRQQFLYPGSTLQQLWESLFLILTPQAAKWKPHFYVWENPSGEQVGECQERERETARSQRFRRTRGGLQIFSCTCHLIWRRQWQPIPELLPGKSPGRRSLVGCSPWGHWESDMTEQLHSHFSPSHIGEGNGNQLQCSCLENPRDSGAWWAAIYGVAQSRIRLKRLSSSRSSSHLIVPRCDSGEPRPLGSSPPPSPDISILRLSLWCWKRGMDSSSQE